MTTPLIKRFLNEAPDTLKQRFAYDCADRAVHIYAVHALQEAGLHEQADKLAALPTIRDKGTANAAANAANAANAAATRADYTAANAANAAANAANAAANAYAANAAFWAYGRSEAREREERNIQERWIRRHWLKEGVESVDLNTLAAIDAYITNGLLIEDE